MQPPSPPLPQKGHPLLSHQPPYKGPVKPSLFENVVEGSNPPPPPQKRGEGGGGCTLCSTTTLK